MPLFLVIVIPFRMSNRPISEIESKWQDAWEREGVYHAAGTTGKAPKFFGLIEFPYPSGDGLHVGHPRSYVAIDILTRKRRMEGKNVLYPIGWDAFGMPTENYAIKFKVKPQDATKKNIATFTRQIKSLGIGFDWSREIDTTDPKYYKWTQWQFLKFYNAWYDELEDRARPIEELFIPPTLTDPDAKRAYVDSQRLAYKTLTTINWCPKDKIGLANEEVVGGCCERCGTPVEKREKAQWMIRITKYAERLINDLDSVDYLDKIKAQQINWIGKSEGAYITFVISTNEREEKPPEISRSARNDNAKSIRVFTTRPDTLFGATYMVLAPEHPLVEQITTQEQRASVNTYIKEARAKSDEERGDGEREKTGVWTGAFAVNPVNDRRIPVWIADYVLSGYGTGAIMAVPAHDERDFAFAKQFDLPIIKVVQPPALDVGPLPGVAAEVPSWKAPRVESDCFVGEGEAVNSDFLDGLPTWKAKDDMISWLEEKGIGARATTYRLRDWVFSRQRYWGEPIPLVHCASCGWVPVPEEQLPVELPVVDAYEPTDTGESPLAKMTDWVNTVCPVCGGKATRETDTMPNWAGSSWYFLRYCDPQNDKELASLETLKYWMPVDLYNGGMEHTTLHLLYSRFWYKFLWDLGVVPKECGNEPYRARRSHGLVLAEGGEKMSKSKGNVINPDEIVAKYGADVLRVYEMFMGPFDQPVPWDVNGIEGVRRFLDKVWWLFEQSPILNASNLDTLYHQTVKKITDNIDKLQFNTCVSQLMILANAYQDAGGIPDDQRDGLLKLLAPFAPHLAEEIWRRGEVSSPKGSIHVSPWPAFDASKLESDTFELVIQVNGKVRDRITVPSDIAEEDAKARALASEPIKNILKGEEPKKVIYIPKKLVNIVV